MMKNNSYNRAYSEKNTESLSDFLQDRAINWNEKPEDEWSLHNIIGIFKRRCLIIASVVAVVTSLSVYSTWRQKPEYQGNFRILVEPLNDNSQLLDVTSSNNSNVTKSNLDYESQIQVLKNPRLIGEIVKQLQKSYPQLNSSTLTNSLGINRVGETKIIEVSYRSDQPEKVQAVLNQVARTYLDYSLKQRQTSLRQGLQFVEEQLQKMQSRVDKLQKEQQLFQQKYNFVDPRTHAEQIASQSQQLSASRLSLNQELANARANFNSLQGDTGEIANLNDASVYQRLILQLRELETKIAEESTRFQDNSPTVIGLKEKRAKLLPLLSQEAERFLDVQQAKAATELNSLEQKNIALTRVEQQLEQKRKQLPQLTREYTELQRKLVLATDSLNRFLSNRENLQIQVAQIELPWELIQTSGKPQAPINRNIRRSLLSGFAISLILGIAAALLLEKLDRRFHSVGNLKNKIKQPLLGNIPFEKLLEKENKRKNVFMKVSTPRGVDLLAKEIPGLAASIVDSSATYSANFLEAKRVLYTNLQLLTPEDSIKSIVVSSAMSGDGKSTVAVHLADIAVAMGQRVLLVDANLRQPRIHHLVNLNNQWGLSNLISTNLPMTEAIRISPSANQLSVITAGPIPPDPIKLISSEKMKRLMGDFRQSFDLVIYDTPSVVGLADTMLLAPNTDGVLLVTRIDRTDMTIFQRAVDTLEMAKMKILGIVGNGQKSGFSIKF
ncbi:MAG: polysaccharide biosynthesis tyrosine autokinase [Cyanobacteria bacterium P01_A01_bin.84]